MGNMYAKSILIFLIIITIMAMFACDGESTPPGQQGLDIETPEATASDELNISMPTPTHGPQTGPIEIVNTDDLIQPTDLVYQGAFRLPDEWQDDYNMWGYSGYAATYYPDGDPQGSEDGFPGSIFAVGHDQTQAVSEISIPAPVISKDLNDLNTATTLQGFQDITDDIFGYLEIPRAGLEYLPAQGSQTTGKLYFCWGQHFQFELE